MSIYVETVIGGTLEELWQKTQNPKQHQAWDLRFSQIDYLPREDQSQPQQFRYTTRLGFGLFVRGEGESVAVQNGSDRRRTSSLKFGSDDPKSLIESGSGYWQYRPEEGGVRFLTRYDYRTRFGLLGRWLDGCLFRPLMAWATAWSFDRLRLWIERGVHPAASLNRSVIHAICRFTVAPVWMYQGLMPKILFPDATEFALLSDAGISGNSATALLTLLGLFECIMALFTLILFQSKWPFVLTIVLMVLVIAEVMVNSPWALAGAFNPITLNGQLLAISVIGLLSLKDLPSASNCVWQIRSKP